MGQYINRPQPDPRGSSSTPLCLSGDWVTLHPALTEFLALEKWEDGSSRTPGSLTLFTDGGVWKLCLSDKDSDRIAFVSATSVGEVFLCAEEQLCRSLLDWRPNRRNGSRKKGSGA